MHAPPVEHDLLEVVEVGLQPDLHQRLLDERPVQVVGADPLEVRGLGKGAQLLDQTLLRRVPFGGARLADGAHVGVGVEREVGVLQRFEPSAELVVQQALQQLDEGSEGLPLLVRHLVGAHRDDIGLAERDESLTGHGGPSASRVHTPDADVRPSMTAGS